ncbi:hypothetical protein [Selenomonas artemidis]|uniref:hypothetical protein n=1 Tax=Selenomonas artemidis TaxID=671224 RepID=UPI0028EDE647|nr:hypothetical protein [Selenomonas artemidis]
MTGIARSDVIEESFNITEMGLFAEDPDEGEILYMVAVDSVPDVMPNKNTQPPITVTYNWSIVSGNTQNIKATVSPAALVTNSILGKTMNEHNTDPDAHPNLGLHIRKNFTAYAVGDIAYCQALPSWARLECVKAGTTASTEPTEMRQMSAGGVLLADGTVKWIIDDIRDCTPIGSVRGSLYLPPGYIKANGATVQRADYPRLVAWIEANKLWTNGIAANAGLFGRGDGAVTMVLPNWADRMVQYAADGAGAAVEAGLPNITGQTKMGFIFGNVTGVAPTSDGAVTVRTVDATTSYSVGSGVRSTIGIDASKSNPIYGKSNTVQPAAIKVIPIIRY